MFCMIYPQIYLFIISCHPTRYGTVVSLLAVSRLLLVFDYTYGALVVWRKELLAFHSLVRPTSENCTYIQKHMFVIFLTPKVDKNIKEPFLITTPVHWRQATEQYSLRFVLRRQLKMILIRNRRTRKPNKNPM